MEELRKISCSDSKVEKGGSDGTEFTITTQGRDDDDVDG
jgi:hypothetical protein